MSVIDATDCRRNRSQRPNRCHIHRRHQGSPQPQRNPPPATAAEPSAFSVTTDGNDNAVTAVTISGSTVELSINNSINSDQKITVRYKDPSEHDDEYAVQDVVGNDAASLSNQYVINNSKIDDSDNENNRGEDNDKDSGNDGNSGDDGDSGNDEKRLLRVTGEPSAMTKSKVTISPTKCMG